jgi:Na+/phosphate symporter
VIAPFAGIAFLWFIAVVRDRLGELEDRFFSTVFLGSGLLFLAMTFVSTAVAGGVLAVARDSNPSQNDIVDFGREVVLHLNNVYGIRMAGVFMISLATIWLRTGLMPRWLVITTYLLALILLIVVSFSLWVTLAFPIWVFVISAYILALARHESDHPT